MCVGVEIIHSTFKGLSKSAISLRCSVVKVKKRCCLPTLATLDLRHGLTLDLHCWNLQTSGFLYPYQAIHIVLQKLRNSSAKGGAILP